MKTRHLVLAFSALLAIATTVSALDNIRAIERNIRADVTAMSPTHVSVSKSGVETKIPVNQIVSISYDDEPEQLADARVRIRSGQLEEAIKQLKSIDQSTIDRIVIVQDIEYYIANCSAQRALGGAGNATLKDAGRMMLKFINDHPGSYHYFEANEILGDLLVADGKAQNAMTFYAKAAKAPWPEAGPKIAVARARALQAQRNDAQAIVEFDKVLSSGGEGKLADRLRLAAKLGKAVSLARTNKGPDGLKLVDDVIRAAEKGDTEIHARAYNAKGECYLALQQPKKAVIAYLHVDTLYSQNPAMHAQALANIASIWQAEKPDRAASALKKLQSQYPLSKYTPK